MKDAIAEVGHSADLGMQYRMLAYLSLTVDGAAVENLDDLPRNKWYFAYYAKLSSRTSPRTGTAVTTSAAEYIVSHALSG